MENSSTSSESTTGGHGTSSGYYHSKYGDVAILNGENYTEFKQTCELALTVANVLSIAKGTETRPNRDMDRWDGKANKAIQIIVNSVTLGIRNRIIDLLMDKKVKEAWELLVEYDLSTNTTFQMSVRGQFHRERWNIQSESIWQFIERLESYRSQLRGAEKGITDEEMHTRILDSLPTDSFWMTTRQNVFLQNLSYQKLVTFLDASYQQYKSLHGLTESRPRKARGGKRGNKFHGNRRTLRGRKGSNSKAGNQEQLDSDQCRFCLKKGHFMKDCKAFLKAQSYARSGVEKQKNEYVNMVTHIPALANDDGYYSYGPSNPQDNQHALVTAVNDMPKNVRVADGSTVEALGHGEVIILTTYGPIQIDNVWYAPRLCNRLLSTDTFNDSKVSVLFEDHKAFAIRNGQVIFQGHTNYCNVDAMLDCATGVNFRKPTVGELLPGDTACEACLAGRMKESFNKTTDSCTDVLGRRLHCDISGIKAWSVQGYRFFLLITDDAICYTWIYFLRSKESVEVLGEFKQLLQKVERECNTKVTFVRADNGKSEFGEQFQSYLKSLGINFEPSPPYKHSMNSVIECAMQVLKNRTLTAALPYERMCYSVTPYGAYYTCKPDLSKLKVFGCAAISLLLSAIHGNKNQRKQLLEEYITVVNYPLTTSIRYEQLVAEQERYSMVVAERPRAVVEHPEAPCALMDSSLLRLSNNSLLRSSNNTAVERVIQAVEPQEMVLPAVEPGIVESRAEAVELSSNARQVVEPEVIGLIALKEPESPVIRQKCQYRRKDVVNPEIYKTMRSGRILKKAVFPDVVAMAIAKQLHSYMPMDMFTVEEAMKMDPEGWIQAILRELQSLQQTRTFSIVKKPQNRTVIHCKWVCRDKFNERGVLEHYKAWLVIKGFEQKYGVDYTETFASVVKYNTLRTILAIAAVRDLEIYQMDVETVFLNPTLSEEIYMEIPEYFELVEPSVNSETYCLLLNKALYSLKQAPKAWFQDVDAYFKSIGFMPSTADPNLYTRDGAKGATGQGRDPWPVEVQRLGGGKVIRLYISKLLERFRMANCNPISLPMDAGTVLSKVDEIDPQTAQEDDYILLEPSDHELYQQLVGTYIYLSNGTRPDISYPVSQLARHMASPCVLHLQLAKCMLRYLKGTITVGILYNGTIPEGSNLYTLYSDATWGTEGDRKSFNGWAATRAGGAILWVAQRQKSTALSSMEAEIMAGSEAMKEVAWLEKVNRDLKETYNHLPTLHIDNLGVVELIHHNKYHKKVKHIDIRFNYIRFDMVEAKRLVVEHIPGTEQPADLLTKQLPISTFMKHCHSLGIREFEQDHTEGAL
ncbi:hypothetical protein B7463_g12518, partial [Scytalidium lignicola]